MDGICTYYAHKCVCLYWIILNYTKLGNNPHLFGFSEFVIAALSHMQDGLTLDQRRGNHPIVLIPPHDVIQARNFDRILELPDSIIPEFLKGKQKQIEAVKISIKSALQSAVEKENISPELLKVNSIDIDDVPAFLKKY